MRQNIPDPFNPHTTIHFDLPTATRVQLRIYDARGRVVRTLVDRDMPLGYHQVVWKGLDNQGRQVASGVYHYVIRAGDFTSRKSMVLVK